jgi:AcrR family transcriptional regulator
VTRVGLSHDRVVAEAAAVADELGLDRLTLAAVATRLGVRVPSLYKHVGGLDALRGDLAVLGVRELTSAVSRAAVGRAGRDALHAIADAYRGYATAHPGRYAAGVRGPGPEDAELVAANEALITVLLAALRAYGIAADASSFGRLLTGGGPAGPDDGRPVTDAIDAVRALRAAIHGFVTLEAAGGFGLARPLDATYRRMIDALGSAFAAWAEDAS